LDVYADRIAALQDKLAQEQQTSGEGGAATDAPLVSPGLNLNSLVIDNASVKFNMGVAGGLTVGGASEFKGSAFFRGLVTFVEKAVFKHDVAFEGRVTVNNDTAGYATIYPTQQEVVVKFDKPYEQTPVVVVSLKNGLFAQYSYTELTPESFKIVLPKPATEQLDFSWFALSVKDAKTVAVPTPSPSPSVSPPAGAP
jgi:hypothetical protein